MEAESVSSSLPFSSISSASSISGSALPSAAITLSRTAPAAKPEAGAARRRREPQFCLAGAAAAGGVAELAV
eukprot:5964096-Pleurochrysis_carterae.AAC.1